MPAMDIDDLVNDANEREAKHGSADKDDQDRSIDGITDDVLSTEESGSRERIGIVERFFSKASVVAIKLEAELSIGDLIEIDTGNGAVSETVSSMQIDRESITRAQAGDSVGIKLGTPVPSGSIVYMLKKED